MKQKSIFIIGVEGSGTTLLSNIFGKTLNTKVILGNYISEELLSQREIQTAINNLNSLNSTLWDLQSSSENYFNSLSKIKETYDLLKQLLNEKHNTQNIVLKRSIPFNIGDRYIPDLFDIVKIFGDTVKIILMVRDPKESSYSALRRGFLPNIRTSSLVCNKSLLHIISQYQVLKQNLNILVINYKELCTQQQKIQKSISEFTGININEITKAFNKIQLSYNNHDKWKSNLNATDKTYLEKYFNEERMKQYKEFNL